MIFSSLQATMNQTLVRTILGIIGNVTSFCLFASPMPTVFRIWKNKSVEEFVPDPYIAAVMNCVCWVFYGMPFNHPHSTLVITINSIGLLLELGYLTVFFWFGDKKSRWKIVVWLCIEAIVFAAIAAIDLKLFHTHEKRSMFVGIVAVVFGIILYSSPLTIMRKVIRTKSVEYMPFWLSVAAFSNGVIWAFYALIPFDLYIFVSNGIGAVLGTLQLSLYAIYFKSTPKKEETKAEVQLQRV